MIFPFPFLCYRCQKSARRENNMVALERQEFRRQLQIFQKWQTENKDLRRKVKLQDLQVQPYISECFSRRIQDRTTRHR